MTLLNMSFYGAVIILAILIIRAFTLHKLPKKTFLVLWGVALLRLLLPFEIASGFSIYSLFPQETTATVLEDPSEPFREYRAYLDSIGAKETENSISVDENAGPIHLPVENPDIGAIHLPHSETEAQTAIGNTTENVASISPVADNTTPILPLYPIFWAAGLLACVAFFLISYIRCRLEFNTSLPVTEDYAAEWLARHPLKRNISIRQSDKISAPLTYGIFQPVILLPKRTDWEDKKQLDYILYHEYTHIRRFDLVAKLVMIATLCLHWFNPLVWAMYFFFNRDLELSCDECVVKHSLETEKTSYARTLISMEEQKNFSTPLCNHFSKNAIEERITAIMKMQKVTFGTVLLGVALIVIVAVTLTTSAKETNAEQGTPPQPTATPTPTPSPTPWPTATPSPTPWPTTTQISDGTYAAIIKGCTETSLLLDFVEYVTDDDVARKAELIEQLKLEPGIELEYDGSFTNGYYIYNPDSEATEYNISKDVAIKLIDWDSGSGYMETSEFHIFLSHIITEYGWSKMPYFFEIENNVVTGIHEKILP